MAYGRKCEVCPAKFRHYHHGGDPRPLPSVTEVLDIIAKPALIGWSFKKAREAALAASRATYELAHPGGHCLALNAGSYINAVDKATPKSTYQLPKTEADIGTMVHARIESEMRRELGQDVPVFELPEWEVIDGKRVPHQAWNAYQSYLAWRKSKEIKIVSVEQRVWSLKLGIAGTADVVMYVGDVLTVGDFKTSKAVYWNYKLQVAAYRAAVAEMEGLETPIGGVVLRFPKDPGDGFDAVEIPWADQKKRMGQFKHALGLWWARQEEEG
jgi:hypothetical protein